MKEIVVISGKGGTGKTSITASFAWLGKADVIVADCDVDAADMHMLLQPDFRKTEDFYSGQLAVIDEDKCINCGLCAGTCRFEAIPFIHSQHVVDPLSCEGCGYCSRVCPEQAIMMIDRYVGKYYISTIKTGSTMVHAKLNIGSENSGKLVANVKNEAKRLGAELQKDYIIVDGSPGIGCPVVSSLSGANYVVLVTEPTVSGLHDLKRVYELVKKFRIPAGCIINKSDLNPQLCKELEDYLNDENIIHISSLPYDESFTKAMTHGQTIMEFENGNLKNLLNESWEKVKLEIPK